MEWERLQFIIDGLVRGLIDSDTYGGRVSIGPVGDQYREATIQQLGIDPDDLIHVFSSDITNWCEWSDITTGNQDKYEGWHTPIIFRIVTMPQNWRGNEVNLLRKD